jgi:hypothetical protein
LVICPNKTAPAAAAREIAVDALFIDCLLRDFSLVIRRTVVMPRENPGRGSGGCSRTLQQVVRTDFSCTFRANWTAPRPPARRLPVAASAANLQQNIAAAGVDIKPARVTRRGSIGSPRNGTADSQLLYTQLSRFCQWQ